MSFTLLLTSCSHCLLCTDNIPFNWMKGLPWNVSKTQRLQQQLDSQLMSILVKRLAEMGISVQQQQQPVVSSVSGSTAKCPVPGVSAAVAAASNGSSSKRPIASSQAVSSTSSASSSSSDAECPFQDTDTSAGATSAETEQLMLDSKDILSLAVKLCRQESGGGKLDLEMLLR